MMKGGKTVSIKYKIDVLSQLKAAGYSSYKIRKEKIIGERTLTQIRNGEPINWNVLNKLCQLLNCQPADIIEYVED